MFGLARHAGVPIGPIGLRYLDVDAAWVGDASFFPHFLKTVARCRTLASLEFGPPIHPRADERAEAVAGRARAAVRALLRDSR